MIGAAYDADAGTLQFYKNGTLQNTVIPDVGFLTGPWYAQIRQNRNAASHANFGQQPFAASNVTYDQDAGTVEIDGETYNTFYQTWKEWNDVVTLRADNPEHVAKFEAIVDSLDDYAAERAQFRADLRQRLIDAGFSQSELVTMSLVDDGEVAFAKEGYFPLYLTEAEANNASSTGTSHAHTIEGETFYMPDAGVTIYHGNYPN